MPIQKILVPTDFSPTAHHAVEQAAELAIRDRAELHLFHIVEPLAGDAPGMTAAVHDFLERLERDAQQALVMKIERLRGRGVNVFYSTSRRETVFDGIARRAAELEPDLLAMGTRGLTGLQHAVLGSATERVVRRAEVAVLTVHGGDSRAARA